ncbi:hypothetical protein F5H01DRAFT_333929 [Linnemannia elongata]|nr:hypothetical protein F5H01DRAFT_333929 [Linnemannia elongata]
MACPWLVRGDVSFFACLGIELCSFSHIYIALSFSFPFFPFLALSLFVALLGWQPICCTCQDFFFFSFCLYYALCSHISFSLSPLCHFTLLFLSPFHSHTSNSKALSVTRQLRQLRD